MSITWQGKAQRNIGSPTNRDRLIFATENCFLPIQLSEKGRKCSVHDLVGAVDEHVPECHVVDRVLRRDDENAAVGPAVTRHTLHQNVTGVRVVRAHIGGDTVIAILHKEL